ncbi:MAG: HAD hydrolase-like protein [Clostridium sp.]|nr:HAD hydrolase-like protein [Clostridium sp.]
MVTKLLFDLDGTLTDPKEGICKSVQYALRAFGIEEPDIDKLEPFIGPPLTDSFMEFYGMTKERALEAVEKYRERFSVTGWAENFVYEGVPRMLKGLREAGCVLAVASSKPTVFVERILTHFDLRDAFSVVVGSELDGRRVSKDEVIKEALRQLCGSSFAERGGTETALCMNGQEDGEEDGQSRGVGAWKKTVRRDELLMIGDRKFDVEGAHALGIRCVGVTYGYAPPGELAKAQADFLADSPDELLELLLGLRGSGT